MSEQVRRKLKVSMQENARLKTEVERLTKHDDGDCRHFIMRTLLESQNTFLNARVERLTKAGDDMAFHYQELVRIEWGSMTTHIPPSVVRWLAAKEGKPSV